MTKKSLARIPDPQKYELYDLIRQELHKMWKAGDWLGNPNDHPIQALTRLAYDGDTNPSLRFLCLKTLLEFVAVPKSAQLRIEQNGNGGDTNITVVVQGWAAGKRADEPVAQSPVIISPSRSIEDGRTDRD